MTEIDHCPEVLPHDLTQLVERFGDAWAVSPCRPRPAAHVIDHWSALLVDWANSAGMPLFVRKHSNNRGSVVLHESGRALIPCDNSPAHWAYVMALKGQCPTLDDIRGLLAGDSIPVAMIQKGAEKPTARYHCTLPKDFNVNTYGWKLAHIDGVGLNTQTSISAIPLERLIATFHSLMAPGNMFLVPLAWAGIAEIKTVIDAVASSR